MDIIEDRLRAQGHECVRHNRGYRIDGVHRSRAEALAMARETAKALERPRIMREWDAPTAQRERFGIAECDLLRIMQTFALDRGQALLFALKCKDDKRMAKAVA